MKETLIFNIIELLKNCSNLELLCLIESLLTVSEQ